MPGSLRCFGLQGATSLLPRMEGHVSMILTIMVLSAHCFKSYGSPLASPLSYMLGSKSIWLAIFSIQVVFCHDKESEDGVTVTADELAMPTVGVESPKIDV
jgi:hypothetical protein